MLRLLPEMNGLTPAEATEVRTLLRATFLQDKPTSLTSSLHRSLAPACSL